MSTQKTRQNYLALDGSDRHLKINLQTNHYGFAKRMNALPLAQSEFELACKNYPIVFIAADADESRLQSVVLLSLTPEDNWFVHADQSWEPYHYIPAFVKRHPFHLGLDEQQQKQMVYVDQNYPGLNYDEGLSFFEEDAPSDYLEQLTHALRTLQIELEQTQLWIGRLKEKGLLVQQAITTTVGDKTEQLAGVWVVDMEKMSELDDLELAKMYHNGTLALIEQHRLSLSNLDVLAQRASI